MSSELEMLSSEARNMSAFKKEPSSTRVLVVVDNAPVRIERVHKVVMALRTKGYHVNVAYPRGLETLSEYENVPIASVSRPPVLHYLSFTIFLFLHIMINAPDVVHFVNLPDIAVSGILLARKLRHFKFVYDRQAAFSVIVQQHHTHWALLARIVENLAYMNADAILVVVPEFERELKMLKGKVFLVPNGVDLREFKRRQRKKIGTMKVLVVAALTYCEGIDVFIRAARLVRDSVRDVRFLVVGDGELAGELRRLSRSLGEPVEFKGWVSFDKIPSTINEADICVSSVIPTVFTDYAYPVKLFEYMACGKPVVVSNIKGHLELVHDMHDALVYEFSSPEDLAEKVKRLIRDKDLRQRLGINGLKVAHDFSWERCSSTLIQAYKSMAQ